MYYCYNHFTQAVVIMMVLLCLLHGCEMFCLVLLLCKVSVQWRECHPIAAAAQSRCGHYGGNTFAAAASIEYRLVLLLLSQFLSPDTLYTVSGLTHCSNLRQK